MVQTLCHRRCCCCFSALQSAHRPANGWRKQYRIANVVSTHAFSVRMSHAVAVDVFSHPSFTCLGAWNMTLNTRGSLSSSRHHKNIQTFNIPLFRLMVWCDFYYRTPPPAAAKSRGWFGLGNLKRKKFVPTRARKISKFSQGSVWLATTGDVLEKITEPDKRLHSTIKPGDRVVVSSSPSETKFHVPVFVFFFGFEISCRLKVASDRSGAQKDRLKISSGELDEKWKFLFLFFQTLGRKRFPRRTVVGRGGVCRAAKVVLGKDMVDVALPWKIWGTWDYERSAGWFDVGFFWNKSTQVWSSGIFWNGRDVSVISFVFCWIFIRRCFFIEFWWFGWID